MANYSIRAACDADASSWNQYILNISDNPCYLFYEWRSLIEKVYQANTLLLIAEDEKKNILGILFSYHLNRPAKSLYTPEFGIVSDSSEVLSSLIAAANQYSFENKLSSSLMTTGNVALSAASFDESVLFSDAKQWIKTSFVLDLSAGSESVWSSLSSSSRNKIRKSEKAGIKIASGLDYFEPFYKLYLECYSKKQLNLKSYAFFENLIDLLKSNLELFVCLHDDEVVSGAFFLSNNKRTSYLYNASSSDYRHLGLNDFLIWEAAKYFTDKDFLGINLGESLPGSGAYNFKAKQLKCPPTDVHYYSWLNQGASNKLSTISEKVREKMLISLCKQRYLPSPLMNKLLMKRALFGRFI